MPSAIFLFFKTLYPGCASCAAGWHAVQAVQQGGPVRDGQNGDHACHRGLAEGAPPGHAAPAAGGGRQADRAVQNKDSEHLTTTQYLNVCFAIKELGVCL